MNGLLPSADAFITYHHLLVKLDDGSCSMVRIDRYLNAAETSDPRYPPALKADQEKDKPLSAIAVELNKGPLPPLEFEIAGRR
jgi:hypothetical protein